MYARVRAHTVSLSLKGLQSAGGIPKKLNLTFNLSYTYYYHQ